VNKLQKCSKRRGSIKDRGIKMKMAKMRTKMITIKMNTIERRDLMKMMSMNLKEEEIRVTNQILRWLQPRDLTNSEMIMTSPTEDIEPSLPRDI
jgi:hypothetical protein